MLQHLTFARVRDTILLVTGLGIIGHETLYATDPRAVLIGLAAGMIGLPATFLADRKFTTPAILTPSKDSPTDKPAEAGDGEDSK